MDCKYASEIKSTEDIVKFYNTRFNLREFPFGDENCPIDMNNYVNGFPITFSTELEEVKIGNYEKIEEEREKLIRFYITEYGTSKGTMLLDKILAKDDKNY